ncbi:MAG: methyl-accepting chemotaxis protein [Treponema sp.]|nr:methyl-accepting chemotaxis protein [Treponema sp.]
MPKKTSLKKTILITFIAVSFISSISIFFIAVRYSRLTVRSISHDDISIIADRINDTIGEVIQEKFNTIEYIAMLDSIRDENVSLQEKQAILSPLDKDKSKDLISMSFIDANGDVYISPEMKMNFMSAPIVQQVINEKKTVLVGPTADNISNELSINIGTPVFNKDKKFIGLLLARLDCKFLCEISSRIRIGQTGYAIFIDRATGNTIGAPEIDDVKNQQNLMQIAEKNNFSDLKENMTKLLAGEKSWGYFKAQGVERVMVYEPISNTHWSVVIMANEKEFIGKLKSMENLIFVVTVIFLIAAILAAVFITRELNPLKKVAGAISEISSGNADLTQRITIKRGKREIIETVDGFNDFVKKLQEIVSSMKNSELRLEQADNNLQNGTQETSSAITQIIANIQSVNNQIQNQAQSVEETAGAVNQIASNIESLERMIQNQSEGVSQASSAVEEMIGNITSVNNSVDIMFNSFKELESNTNAGIRTQADVNDIIKQIEAQSEMLQEANSAIASIASQTNLLAMNAAIEAAHAGESGKGFSVVADEIRKLSETSTNQSKTIGDELNKIQESINSVVTASSEATSIFTSVSTSIQNTDQLVRHIKSAMEEQQVGSKQIIDVLHTMNDSTIEVRSASTEMAEGNKQILVEINKLQDVTSVIRESINEMSVGAEKINQTGISLSDVSSEVTNSINSIKDEIDQFKV